MEFPNICLHEWEVIAWINRAEVSEGDAIAHTSFTLIGCVRCRTVDAFPASNAALITPRYRDRLTRELAAGGWRLPESLTWYGDPLYNVARHVTHEAGMSWTDPRTGVTYPPPGAHDQ